MSFSRSALRRLACSTLTAALAWSSSALADVSSWLQVAAGPTLTGRSGELDAHGTLDLLTGLGTDPGGPWVLGPVLRLQYQFAGGVDLTPALRFTSGGYTRGELGFAIDAGPWFRLYDGGATGAYAAVTVGGPWGTVATLNGAFAGDAAQAFGVLVGIDLLRLTVYRHSGEQHWPNPFPAPPAPTEEQLQARQKAAPKPPAAAPQTETPAAPSAGAATPSTSAQPSEPSTGKRRKRVGPSTRKPLVDPETP